MNKYYLYNEDTKEYLKNFDQSFVELTKNKDDAIFWEEKKDIDLLIEVFGIDIENTHWHIKQEKYI